MYAISAASSREGVRECNLMYTLCKRIADASQAMLNSLISPVSPPPVGTEGGDPGNRKLFGTAQLAFAILLRDTVQLSADPGGGGEEEDVSSAL